MKRILFVCIHNSARSQMAEAFLNHYGKAQFSAESAGIEEGKLNPLVVKAMHEIGIDISNNQTKDVSGLIKQNKQFDTVITVCDTASAAKCPTFPGLTQKLAWLFEDPSTFDGSASEKLQKIRLVRDK